MSVFSISSGVADVMGILKQAGLEVKHGEGGTRYYVDGREVSRSEYYRVQRERRKNKTVGRSEYTVGGRKATLYRYCKATWRHNRLARSQGWARRDEDPQCRWLRHYLWKKRQAAKKKKEKQKMAAPPPPPPPSPKKKPHKPKTESNCVYPLEKAAYERLKKHVGNFDALVTARNTKNPNLVCLELKKWNKWPLWALPAYFVDSGWRANKLAGLSDSLAMRMPEGGGYQAYSCIYFGGKRINCKKPVVSDVSKSACGRITATERGKNVCNGLINELEDEADRLFLVALLEFAGLIIGVTVLQYVIKRLLRWWRGRRRGRGGDDDRAYRMRRVRPAPAPRVKAQPKQQPQPVAPEPKVTTTQPTAADWNALAPQPTAAEWNAMAPPAPVPVPTLTPEPKGAPVNPTYWNAMVAPAPISRQQVDLQAIAGSMVFQPRQEGGFELSSALGVKLHFFKMGRESLFTMEGLAHAEDAVPLVYYALKRDVTNVPVFGMYPSVASDYFLNRVKEMSGSKISIDESDRQFGAIGHMDVGQLLNRVSSHLEDGYDMFDLEATISHIDAYFHNGTSEWHNAQRIKIDGVMKMLFGGDGIDHFYEAYIGLSEVLKEVEGDIPKPQTERGVVSALLSLGVSEMAYRIAACEIDIDRRRSFLEEAKWKAYYASSMIYQYEVSSTARMSRNYIGHRARIVEGLAEEGLAASDGVGACDPVGRSILGYGLTSASVAPTNRAGLWRIVPLTSIKVMGR